LVSFLEYPADPPRSDDEMRRLVQRWIGPALMINAHQGLGTE
jgi:hypothetical protein